MMMKQAKTTFRLLAAFAPGLRRAVMLMLACWCAVGVAMSQTTRPRDVTTLPNDYFLREGDVAGSVALLPPPPQPGTIRFMYDEAQYQWGKLQRDTPRGEQAMRDARLSSSGVVKAFSEAFGIEISQEHTPEIYRLVTKMREDAGDLATREAKNHYRRMRPFTFFREDTCLPEEQESLSANGSYPSGHTAIGWATALVLAEVNVARQNEILQRGYDIGQSRVICGYHYQSDVDAARLVASAVVARLHADDAFMQQLGKAKAEFKMLQKRGKIGTSSPSRQP